MCSGAKPVLRAPFALPAISHVHAEYTSASCLSPSTGTERGSMSDRLPLASSMSYQRMERNMRPMAHERLPAEPAALEERDAHQG